MLLNLFSLSWWSGCANIAAMTTTIDLAHCHLDTPSHTPGVLLGALSQRLPLSQGQPLPEGYNVHLMPDGEFAAMDGRPGSIKGSKTRVWRLDAALAERIVAAANARQTPLVVDYEHQSLLGDKPAGGVPAAGWIEALAYFPGLGLFARVSWTPRAKAYIDADEYRYISPAFHFDKDSGAITALVNAALTNTPALDGLCPVAAAQIPPNTPEETAMDKQLLALLRALLGLADDADVAAILAALNKVNEGVTVLACKTIPEALAAKAQPPADPDPAKHVPVEAAAGMQDKIAALTAQIAELAAQSKQGAVDGQIDAALADGRLDKALETWARELGKSDVKSLEAYLSARKPIAALVGKLQTQGAPPPADSTALSAEDNYVIKQLGLDPKAYAAARQGDK